jgi:hypothetical protein
MRTLIGLPVILVLCVLRRFGWAFGVDESC